MIDIRERKPLITDASPSLLGPSFIVYARKGRLKRKDDDSSFTLTPVIANDNDTSRALSIYSSEKTRIKKIKTGEKAVVA